MKLIRGENVLAKVRPDLVEEWDFERNDILTPYDVTVYSHKKVCWRCKRSSHSWSAQISSRSYGSECPYCSGRLPIQGETDLASVRPDLAQEWDYDKNDKLTPNDVTVYSDKKVWWRCRKSSHSWFATISNRYQGKGCPYCAGRIPIQGETDLASIRPDLAQEWDYDKNGKLTPNDVTIYSNKKAWWRCKKSHHSWLALIGNRTQGNGCPYCASKLPIVGQTDLTSVRPDLAEEWDYDKNGKLTPNDVKAYSTKKVWWRCKKSSHSWLAVIGNRSNGTGCPYCSGRLPILGETDLVSVRPDLAEEWDYEKNGKLTPYDFTVKSNKRVWWQCKKQNHTWLATISNRSKGNGCPDCAGKFPYKRRKI